MCKRIKACLPLILLFMSQCDKVKGESIYNLAAVIVKATVKVKVKVSVLEVFPSAQLTSLSVFSGCEFLTSSS
jgi:hypothetical protein